MLDARKWIDPRSVDWTDSLNPLIRSGWRSDVNPYIHSILEDPLWVAIRTARNLEPRILVAPDQPNTLVQPGQTYDQNLTNMEPNSWLLGLTATAQFGANGFYCQVTDSETGKKLFSSPIFNQNLGGAAGGNQSHGFVFYLATPHCFVPPAYPIVRIINNAGAAQLCQVCLYTAVEMDL